MHLPQRVRNGRTFRISGCKDQALLRRKLGAAAVRPCAAERFPVEERVRARAVPLVEHEAAIHFVASDVKVPAITIFACAIGRECDQATTVSFSTDKVALINGAIVAQSALTVSFVAKPLALVRAAVGMVPAACAEHAVVQPLPLIPGAVMPQKHAVTVPLPPYKLPVVLPVHELEFAAMPRGKGSSGHRMSEFINGADGRLQAGAAELIRNVRLVGQSGMKQSSINMKRSL